jgi:REP element-mobilizing transposase RayT
MASYTQNLYHLIFAPKSRTPCLLKEGRDELFKYLAGVFKETKCICYQINGVENHIHFVFYLHPAVSLSYLVKRLKHAGTYYINQNNLFPAFPGWQSGYSAFTYHYNAKDNLVRYVQNQERHHHRVEFLKELEAFFKEHDIETDENYPMF